MRTVLQRCGAWGDDQGQGQMSLPGMRPVDGYRFVGSCQGPGEGAFIA